MWWIPLVLKTHFIIIDTLLLFTCTHTAILNVLKVATSKASDYFAGKLIMFRSRSRHAVTNCNTCKAWHRNNSTCILNSHNHTHTPLTTSDFFRRSTMWSWWSCAWMCSLNHLRAGIWLERMFPISTIHSHLKWLLSCIVSRKSSISMDEGVAMGASLGKWYPSTLFLTATNWTMWRSVPYFSREVYRGCTTRLTLSMISWYPWSVLSAWNFSHSSSVEFARICLSFASASAFSFAHSHTFLLKPNPKSICLCMIVL